MILSRQDLIENRKCHKHKLKNTSLMGSQQDKNIWFIRSRCHKRLGMKGNILCKKSCTIREKIINIKIIYGRQITTHRNSNTSAMQQPSNIWKVQHVHNIDFVHLTLKYMKHSTYVCGVNVYPTYVYVPNM